MSDIELDSLLSEIRAILKPVLERSGAVFYSGRQTFRNLSPYYLMGLNPGGDPDNLVMKEKIENSLNDWQGEKADWSAYCDQYWGKKAKYTVEDHGKSHHQKGVKSIAVQNNLPLSVLPA